MLQGARQDLIRSSAASLVKALSLSWEFYFRHFQIVGYILENFIYMDVYFKGSVIRIKLKMTEVFYL